MVFSNSFGFYNKKSVCVNKTNLNLSFTEIASIEIIKEKKVIPKVVILLLIELVALFVFFNELTEILMVSAFIVVFLTLLFFFNIKQDKIFLKIILCNPKQIFVKIDSSEYEFARDFTNSFTLFRNFNTELD